MPNHDHLEAILNSTAEAVREVAGSDMATALILMTFAFSVAREQKEIPQGKANKALKDCFQRNLTDFVESK